RLTELKHLITIADGTILAALPKLASTIYNRGNNGKPMHGWRLHTHLVLRQHLQADRCYVLDRGYQDAKVFNDIHAAGSSYVVRVRENFNPQVLEERPLSAQAIAGGVIRDTLVSTEQSDHPMRLVAVAGTPHAKRTRSGY